MRSNHFVEEIHSISPLRCLRVMAGIITHHARRPLSGGVGRLPLCTLVVNLECFRGLRHPTLCLVFEARVLHEKS